MLIQISFKPVPQFSGDHMSAEDTFTETQTWLPAFMMGINTFRIFLAWPVWEDMTRDHWNNTVISSLSIYRQLKIRITAWPKLRTHTTKLQEIGNETTKYTGSYFNVVKVSSSALARVIAWHWTGDTSASFDLGLLMANISNINLNGCRIYHRQ